MTLLGAVGARRRSSVRPLNIVVDGNSISDNYYTTIGTFDNHLMMYEPLLSSGATHSCHALSGHSWAQMLTHGAGVDADYVDGATNVLILWETINSLYDGLGVAQVLSDIATYTAARRAAHPDWLILHVETIPYGGSSTYAQMNADMFTIDATVRDNLATYGIDASVNLRTHPAFDHDGTTAAPFQAYASFWNETSVRYVHPTDDGKAVLAPIIATAVGTLAGL